MLSDILEATDRYDLLADFNEANADAENAVMNALTFGICTNYTISSPTIFTSATNSPEPENSSFPSRQTDPVSSSAGPSVTMSIVSIDPYPHHTVAGVQLIRKTIDRDFRLGKITHESYSSLQETLQQTLSHLPSSSKSVKAAREKMAEGLPRGDTTPRQDLYQVFAQYSV